MLRRVDANAMAYEPGHGWADSNGGYLLVRKFFEHEAGVPRGPTLERHVFRPLGISGVKLAREPADLDKAAWGNTRRYHPGLVYYGLLGGTPAVAALFVNHALASDLLPPGLLADMHGSHSVGGAIPGRLWRTASYGLGLKFGQGEPPGEYVGHFGDGLGSTSAIYQLVGGAAGAGIRCTGAAFASVDNPGMVEARAMELAAHGSTHEVS